MVTDPNILSEAEREIFRLRKISRKSSAEFGRSIFSQVLFFFKREDPLFFHIVIMNFFTKTINKKP